MRQMRRVELLNDSDYDIKYHMGKANVVADALNRKERVKPFESVHQPLPSRRVLKVRLLMPS
jgi:hypothetical protein